MSWTHWAKRMLLLSVFAVGAASAGPPPAEYKPPREMTPEEIAASKARSKSDVNPFGIEMENKPEPFPWMLAGMVTLIFLGVAPFAIRSYRQTAAELNESMPGKRVKARSEDV